MLYKCSIWSNVYLQGIRLEINLVSIRFESVAFTATLSLQQIVIYSARENWTQTIDLRETRKQDDREVVTRKKIQWYYN